MLGVSRTPGWPGPMRCEIEESSQGRNSSSHIKPQGFLLMNRTHYYFANSNIFSHLSLNPRTFLISIFYHCSYITKFGWLLSSKISWNHKLGKQGSSFPPNVKSKLQYFKWKQWISNYRSSFLIFGARNIIKMIIKMKTKLKQAGA